MLKNNQVEELHGISIHEGSAAMAATNIAGGADAKPSASPPGQDPTKPDTSEAVSKNAQPAQELASEQDPLRLALITNGSQGLVPGTSAQRFHVAKDDTFPFLKLPPELRLMVYHAVFASMPRPEDGATAKEAEPTALFQLCREIRNEASEEFKAKLDLRIESAQKASEAAIRKRVPYGGKEYQESEARIDALRAGKHVLYDLLARCTRRYMLKVAIRLEKTIGGSTSALDVKIRALFRECI